jgi:ribosomal protein S18 acetylase RimI-like enzyme
MEAISFREANPEDASAIGAMHVESWRETYPGILPDRLLNSLSAESRSSMWAEVLSDPAAFDLTAVFIAEDAGRVVGFGACCEQRHPALKEQGFDGEVGSVYVLRSYQRAGIGKALMALMARNLVSRGRRGASLWVLRENFPARDFYERLGARMLGERAEGVRGTTRIEVAYGWSELSSLESPQT